jgi:heptosyltransferase-2
MGDAILASAVLPFLAERYPGGVIDLVTQRPYHELFAGDPRLHRVHIYDRTAGALAQPPEPGSWDLVVDLQNSGRSRALLRQIAPGAKARRFRKSHMSRLLLFALRLSTYDRRANVVTRYLRAAGWDGGPNESYYPKIVVAPEARQRALKACPGLERTGPTLALAPFAAWQNKTWPLERYAAVARHFMGKGWAVAVFGGPEDQAEAERLCTGLGAGALALAGRGDLAQTAALLSRCALALGNDTGLSHLARAVGVPTAAVYGATTWHFGFFPSGPPAYRTLEARLFCRPCHAHGGNFCWRGGRPCLARVSAAQAIAALEDLADAAEGRAHA